MKTKVVALLQTLIAGAATAGQSSPPPGKVYYDVYDVELHDANGHVAPSDSLFDLEHLPESVAVVGLGAIGLELGQALHRLGVRVTGFDAQSHIAGIADPEINTVAVQTIAREFPLHLGAPVEVTSEAGGVRVKTETQEMSAERVLVAVGRVPNIPEGLSQLCKTDQHGVPRFHPQTRQVGALPIFIAGDARLCSECYRSSISDNLA